MMRLLLVLVCFIAADAYAQIKIGLIASLQGGAAEQGKNWLEGAQLASEEAAKSGTPVTIVVEDDATQPARCATAFNKLSKSDRVQGIIGGTWDFLAEAVYPLALRDKIPFVTPSNPKEILSEPAKKNPFVFTNGLSLAAEEKAIEAFLKNRKLKTIGILTMQNPWCMAHSDMVKRVSAGLGMQVASYFEMSMEEPQTTYKTMAHKLSKIRPDAVYVLADYYALDLFLSELQNLKWNPVVLESQHVEGAYQYSKQNDKRYANVYGVHSKFGDNGFTDRFTRRFDHPPGIFAVEGFDAMKFLIDALSAKVSFGDPAAKFQTTGLKGTMQLPAPGRSLLDDQAVIVQFQKGRRIELNDGQ